MLGIKQHIFLFLTIWLVITTSCGDENEGPRKNYAPKIKLLEAESNIVEPKSKLMIRLETYDIENDPMFFQWSSTGGIIQGDGNGAIWIAPSEERRFQINVNVSDGNKSTNGSLIIQVWSTRPGDYYPLAVGNVWTYSNVKNRKNKIVFEIIDKIQIQLEKDKTVSSYVLSKYDPNLPEYAPNLDDPANPDQKWRIYNFSYLGRNVDENLTPTEILQYAQNVTSGTEDTIMFEPFLSLYRFPLIPGNRWQQSFQAKLTPELFPIGGGSDEFEVISEEDLTVAAGIFNNVFQIQESFSWKLFNQDLDQTIVQKWLAPDVGLIKFTQIQTRGEITVEIDFELESFELVMQ